MRKAGTLVSVVTGLATVALPATAGSMSLSLTAVRDNTLFENASGSISNGAGPAVYAGDNASLNTRRAVLDFDVAGNVPPGSTVVNAELRLHVSGVPEVESRLVNAHKLLADWGEGASYSTGGSGAPAEPGDATWIHRFYPDSLWAAVGGDFVASLSASTAVADTGSYVWSGPQLLADVQSWVDDPSSDFGWILLGEEDVSQSARRIDSREAEATELRPVLWIELGTISVESTSWGETKAAYRR